MSAFIVQQQSRSLPRRGGGDEQSEGELLCEAVPACER